MCRGEAGAAGIGKELEEGKKKKKERKKREKECGSFLPFVRQHTTGMNTICASYLCSPTVRWRNTGTVCPMQVHN